MSKRRIMMALGGLVLTACSHASGTGAHAATSALHAAPPPDATACAADAKPASAELPAAARGVQHDTGFPGLTPSTRPLYSEFTTWLDTSGCSDRTGSQGPGCVPGMVASTLAPPPLPKTRCSAQQAVLTP